MLNHAKTLLQKSYGRVVLGKWHWIADRSCIVSPETKRSILLDYRRKYHLRTLVETGTFRGDTVEAGRLYFEEIYSIELSRKLHEEAKKRFEGDPRIEIVHGDSGTVLPALLARINGPTLFWLDGHYSKGITAKGRKDTPIMDELRAILAWGRKDFCILIDDARLFTGLFGYPRINVLERIANEHNIRFEVRQDIIRLLPRGILGSTPES